MDIPKPLPVHDEQTVEKHYRHLVRRRNYEVGGKDYPNWVFSRKDSFEFMRDYYHGTYQHDLLLTHEITEQDYYDRNIYTKPLSEQRFYF